MRAILQVEFHSFFDQSDESSSQLELNNMIKNESHLHSSLIFEQEDIDLN